MPWTVKDVDKFKKGLSDKQKDKWVKIANNTLRVCLKEKDRDELDCEVKAIRTANSLISEKRQAVISLEEKPNPLIPSKDNDIYMTLTNVPEDIECYTSEEDGQDKWQLAFPIGLFNLSFYGEVIVTKTYVSRMKEHWENKVLGERSVFMDTQHDFGEANAWAKDMRVTDNGLEIKWEFNDRGRELIASNRFRYYSAAIGRAMDINSGEDVYPVLLAVSLTNMPAMNTMPPAQLSAINLNQPTHSDREKYKEGTSMSLQEIIDLLFEEIENGGELTDQQREQVLKVFGINNTDIKTLQVEIKNISERLEVVLDENKALSAENDSLKKEKLNIRKANVIEKALSNGKILPKNKDKWEKMFENDPDGVEQLLSEKGNEVELNEIGSGSGGDESNEYFDEKGFSLFRSMHPELRDEDAKKEYIKYSNATNAVDEYDNDQEVMQ